LDERLRSVYRDRRGDLLASIGFDALGFLVGVLQRSLLIGAVLGFHAFSPGRLLLVGGAVWGVTTLAEMIFFFVAGRLGVREGAYHAAFQAVGFSGAKGVVLSVIGRVDQLFWTAFGFVVYWHVLLRNPSPRPESAAVASPVSK
jgi:hypothetical protein